MVPRRIQYHQALRMLDRVLADMPDYPIYKEGNGQYSIYINGRQVHFASCAAAQMGQLQARAMWLLASDRDEQVRDVNAYAT